MKLDTIFSRTWSSKRWRNVSQFCNGKNHPGYSIMEYRRYRRGKARCHECGYKFGKIKCERKSWSSAIIDNIYTPNPLLAMLSKRSR